MLGCLAYNRAGERTAPPLPLFIDKTGLPLSGSLFRLLDELPLLFSSLVLRTRKPRNDLHESRPIRYPGLRRAEQALQGAVSHVLLTPPGRRNRYTLLETAIQPHLFPHIGMFFNQAAFNLPTRRA